MARQWQPGRPDIRASDMDRERVVSFLRDKAADGCLTPDELDERVGAAYAAVTRGDLDRLVRDLPDPPLATGVVRSPTRHPAPLVVAIPALAAVALPGLLWVLVWTSIALGIALIALVAVLAVAAGPFLALFALAVLAFRRRHARSWRATRFR